MVNAIQVRQWYNTPDGPVPLEEGTELIMSAGYSGQQFYPWKPDQVRSVGGNPSYEVDR